MKKKLYALSGVFLIVLVVTGLWASKAGGFIDQDTVDTSTSRKINGVSMKEMAQGSDLIVIGKCTGIQSQWIDRRVVTLATVEVRETLKGAPSGSLIVEVPGGRANRGKFQLAMTYPDAPTIAPDEEMALFLVPTNEAANTYAVWGSNAGKFSIVQDTAGVKVLANVPMRVAAPRATGLTSGNTPTIELSEFKAMVENLLR
jgi:hypothetical protein